MRSILERAWLPLILGVLLIAGIGLLGDSRNIGQAADLSPARGSIQLAFAPGGVLTRDGALWQYRLDKGVWLTIDDAFAEEGRTTHVIPLPVPASQIVQMQSFGFIVTSSGACWLYDVEQDRWKEIGAPPIEH